jgi:adenylate cyclase class 2
MLDETPIGNYLELEGNPAWIRRLAGRLGAEPREFITKDYGALYAEWCRRRGRKMTDMIFRRHPRRSS